ncbi:hypothetical protein [Salipaludibacillus sp. CF4.18]|uniref:hypothetical protein n=1 Tax=Salipaludibacillus sp. CF4.18 TaxID=3373081 RepID=UPI003EE66894
MDTEALVKSLRDMSNKIIEDHKSVSLIMLLGNNLYERTDAFDYIISAKWLNEYDQEEGMDIVLDYLFDNLEQSEREHISRITIIHTSDPIVQDITRNMFRIGGFSYNIDCQFGNLIIPYAIIFESRYEE